MTARPTLSVVVPFYGVERYLAECLDSLREQSLSDFEAILVDDGSRDGSAAIAEAYAAEDARFRIVHQENQGLGPARNTGVRHATGTYLAFVDSDDVVPPQAYARMVGTLETTGSDMASGNARRFNDLGVRDSALHRTPFGVERLATHVSRFPLLALDRMAWNKVYRRDYWDEQGLAFPAGLYEDYPVTIRSHVLAGRVDVLANPVYYWRERDGGDLSITQRVWEVSNLRERVVSDLSVLDFLEGHAPDLLPVVERHFLQVDVAALAAAVHRNDPADHPEVLALTQRLLERISEPVLRRAPPFDRVQADLVRRGRLAELARLIDHRALHGTRAPVARRGGRWRPHFFRALPFFEDRAVGVPDECYALRAGTLTMGGLVLDAWWEDRARLVLDLRVGIGQAALDPDRARVWLVGPGGESREVEFEERCRSTYRIDLRVRLDAGELRTVGPWSLEVEARALGVRARGRIRAESAARARWSAAREVAPGIWAKPAREDGYALVVTRPSHCVTEVAVDDAALVVSGWFTPGARAGAEEPPAIWARVGGGRDVVAAATELLPGEPGDPAGTARFRSRLDTAPLASHGREDRITERTVWAVRLATGVEAPRGILLPAPARTASVILGGRRISAVSGQSGDLVVHEEYAHPVVHAVEFRSATVRLTGRTDREGARPETVRLRRYLTPLDPLVLEIPLQWSVDEVGPLFTCEVSVPALDEPARAAAVDEAAAEDVEAGSDAQTPWHVLMVDAGGDHAEPVVLDVNAAGRIPGPTMVAGCRVLVVLGRMARLGLTVERPRIGTGTTL